jgi:hypothetical protein
VLRLRLLLDNASASDGGRSVSGATSLVDRHLGIGPSVTPPPTSFASCVAPPLNGFHADFHASSHGDSHAAPSQKCRNGALERQAWIMWDCRASFKPIHESK